MSARFDHELDPIVAKSLGKLRAEIPRDPQKAASGRLEYLAQVKILVNEKKTNQPVSRMPFFGLNGWIDSIRKTWTKKEHRNMLATISIWIVIVTLLFGGSGATAFAAQNSSPPDFLYPVKIFGEELHLELSADPQAQMELRWRYSERRVVEILDILDEGQPIAEEWAVRWNEQFNQALQASAELDEPAMIRALEQSRLRLHLQELRLQAVQANRPEDPGGALEQVRDQLRQQQRQVDSALDDPAAFRRRLGERQHGANRTPNGPMETPHPDERGGGLGPVCDMCTPVLDGTGPGPGPQSTPPCDNCTPAMDGTGPGPGPQSTLQCDNCTPAIDGTGPGPGPQSTLQCDNCTPAMDGTGSGPQHQGGDEPIQPADEGRGTGGSGEGGPDQDSSGAPPDGNGSGDSGNGNEDGGKGEGNCNSCGSGDGQRHP